MNKLEDIFDRVYSSIKDAFGLSKYPHTIIMKKYSMAYTGRNTVEVREDNLDIETKAQLIENTKSDLVKNLVLFGLFSSISGVAIAVDKLTAFVLFAIASVVLYYNIKTKMYNLEKRLENYKP